MTKTVTDEYFLMQQISHIFQMHQIDQIFQMQQQQQK